MLCVSSQLLQSFPIISNILTSSVLSCCSNIADCHSVSNSGAVALQLPLEIFLIVHSLLGLVLVFCLLVPY
jgi:hypothetical protein